MSCFCKPKVYTKPPCTDKCLRLSTLRYTCDSGPDPCGDTLQVDLTQYNDVSASSCGVVYSLYDFDETVFTNVSVTEQGILTLETLDKFVKNEEFRIRYKVKSPCSILSDVGEVYICLKNLCKNVDCNEGFTCNPCTGLCEEDPVDIEISGGTVSGPEVEISLN